MDNKQKVTLFVALACGASALSAYTASLPDIRHLFIVLPLVMVSIFLFFAGYFAGMSKKHK